PPPAALDLYSLSLHDALPILAMAYMSLGFVFALHGLSTPGFLLDVTALPAVTSPLSVVLTAVWMALSTVSTGARGMRWVSRWYRDRKSTRLNSSHVKISYAVF